MFVLLSSVQFVLRASRNTLCTLREREACAYYKKYIALRNRMYISFVSYEIKKETSCLREVKNTIREKVFLYLVSFEKFIENIKKKKRERERIRLPIFWGERGLSGVWKPICIGDSGRLSDNLDSSTHKIACDRKLKEEKIDAEEREKEREKRSSLSAKRINTYYACLDIDEVSHFTGDSTFTFGVGALSRFSWTRGCSPE